MDNKNTEENNNNNKKQNTIIYAILACLFLYGFTATKNLMTTDQISYNKFLSMLENKQVESVIISSSEIKILPKENEEDGSKRKILYTGNVNDPNLINLYVF